MKDARKLFLIDGCGAILSVAVLAVMAKYESIFGMPAEALYPLITLAMALAVYSNYCWFFPPERWRGYMAVAASGNLAYGVLTAGLVYSHLEQLSLLARLYFTAELAVLAALIVVEYKNAFLREASVASQFS